MKLFKKLLLRLLTFIISCTGSHSYAQNTQEINDSLFREVKNHVNAQNDDALYAMLNDNFKAKFSKEKFTGFLKNNLYPFGAVRQDFFLGYKDGISSYKAVCNKAVLECRIGADKAGKIAALQFVPYREPVATKNFTVATDNPMNSALDRQVDSAARQYINKINTVGLSIGILKNGTSVIYNYGTTAKGKDNLPGPEIIFETGSITKTFTATLLAYYVLQHKISPSDPITKYLPDSVASNKNLHGITLQMLANHTSGLPRLPDNMIDASISMLNPYKYYNSKKLFECLKTCPLASAPGETYAYSNLGAGVLGVILEHISGQTYEQMVTDVICKPLGMSNTYQHSNTSQKERETSVYNDKGEPVNMWDMDALAGAGALRSTMHDMLLYAGANMKKDGTSLSEAIALTQHTTYDKEMTIGLGWHKKAIAGMDCYWHNGGTGGSSSYVAFVPERNIAVVALSNAAENVDATAESVLKVLE